MVKNLKVKQYLSNKMKKNINIIDKLFESGFKISDSLNEYTISDPNGAPLNLWSWLPIWRESLTGKYIIKNLAISYGLKVPLIKRLIARSTIEDNSKFKNVNFHVTRKMPFNYESFYETSKNKLI